MNDLQNMSYDEFDKSVPDSSIKTLQIIFVAIGVGVLLFLSVVLVLYFNNSAAAAETDGEIESMMTIVHVVVFVSMFFVSKYIYNMALGGRLGLTGSTSMRAPGSSIDDLLQKIRTAEIIRLALMEMGVFVGLVTLLICVFNGAIYSNSVYWINAFSSIFFWGVIYINFPTKQRIYDTLRNRMI